MSCGNFAMKNKISIIQKFYKMFSADIYGAVPAVHGQQLINFQKEMFGVNAYQHSAKFNQWLFNSDNGSKRYYCFKDGEVIGHQSAVAYPLSVGDATVNGAYAIDLLVRPEWKMKGLGVAMIGSVMNEFDLLVGLGISKEAQAMFKRQGWCDMGNLDLFIKPMSLNGFLNTAHDPFLTKAFKSLLLCYSKTIDWFQTKKNADCLFERFDQFVENHADLYRYYKNSHYTHIKSLSTLSWRYLQNPGETYFKYQLVHQNEGLKSVVIFKVKGDSVKTLKISEIIGDPAWYAEVIRRVVGEAKELGVDRIVFRGLDKQLIPALRSHSFFPRPYGARFMFYCSDENLRNTLQRKEKWRVCNSDGDMEF